MKTNIIILNSAITIPETSSSADFIRLFIQKIKVALYKEKKIILLPIMNRVPEMKENKVVDMEEKIES